MRPLAEGSFETDETTINEGHNSQSVVHYTLLLKYKCLVMRTWCKEKSSYILLLLPQIAVS